MRLGSRANQISTITTYIGVGTVTLFLSTDRDSWDSTETSIWLPRHRTPGVRLVRQLAYSRKYPSIYPQKRERAAEPRRERAMNRARKKREREHEGPCIQVPEFEAPKAQPPKIQPPKDCAYDSSDESWSWIHCLGGGPGKNLSLDEATEHESTAEHEFHRAQKRERAAELRVERAMNRERKKRKREHEGPRIQVPEIQPPDGTRSVDGEDEEDISPTRDRGRAREARRNVGPLPLAPASASDTDHSESDVEPACKRLRTRGSVASADPAPHRRRPSHSDADTEQNDGDVERTRDRVAVGSIGHVDVAVGDDVEVDVERNGDEDSGMRGVDKDELGMCEKDEPENSGIGGAMWMKIVRGLACIV
ncbi:hypothetical protein BJ138DRAFT_1160951 [Hygrophoropsis aurantiaca]|uniref:Uncharacterized protein n=1 Tax=Hygrophoropsis aurantiaca TaxID=72124 RepID=A0ACB8A2A6_9AGAM|nr:hypothetical protein BJ138DRAFT_1160951 [Hygrophoropsis aurantiaca]